MKVSNLLALLGGAALPSLVNALPQAASPSSSQSVTGTTSTPVSTAIPSATAASSARINLTALPPKQPTCQSQIYCPGEILQAVQLAQLFPDSKTFVDKPANKPESQIVSSFANLSSSSNFTIASLTQWVEDNFLGEGLDLQPANITDFNPNPAFLGNISDPFIQGWLKIVHSYWNKLARNSVANLTCSDCPSTLIPLNHTFVVPGGRFRENYYWDTFWILEGLLTGELYSLAKSTIMNFLDEIEQIGFIPNGARIYYLNRSQPPLFTQMLWLYLSKTNDTSLLPRALPLVEKELQWWQTNRTSEFTSPFTGSTYNITRFNVENTAPRPEGYTVDWETAHGNVGGPDLGMDNATIATLYANLASGAESGQDYSAGRWTKEPVLNVSNNLPSLRTLNIINQLPVDLNSILYRNFDLLSKMYLLNASSYNATRSNYWQVRAEQRKAAVLDLFWDPERFAFYDFNTTSNARAQYWSVASYYPYWSGIWPNEVVQNTANVQKAFSAIFYITSHYNGSIPTTLLETGLQWDAPNVWPPHVWIVAQALQNIPADLANSTSFSSYSQSALSFDSIPPNQLGISQAQLPAQNSLSGGPNITSVSSFGELGNVGNSMNGTGALGWRDGLVHAVANRYMASAFCSWYHTGGSIPGVLNQLSAAQLNATNSVNQTGHMFEKFSFLDLDQAGFGGEYTVQDGFGWTNGVAISFGNNFGKYISAPTCPPIEVRPAGMRKRSINW